MKNIIIGAGISGLSAAYFLKKPYLVLEKESGAGGLCRSFYENGFTFDCSGHFIHIKDEKIKNLAKKMCGSISEITRNASIYINGNFVPFPFQANLYYLDEKTKKECVDGILRRKDIEISTKMPFIDWSQAMFGKGITKHFMKPYNEKIWNYDLKKMTAQWTGHFVPRPDAQSIIKSAYSKNSEKYGYNSVFYYPKKNGCQALIDGLLKKCKNVKFNSKAAEIDIKNKTITTSEGKKYIYENLISTQPLTELVRQIKNAPDAVKTAAKKLKYSSVRCVNLGIKSKTGIPKKLKNKHWIYFPDKKLPFYRIGIYSNVTASSAPEKSYSFYAEFSDNKNCENIIQDLKSTGFIGKTDEIVAANIIDMPCAYVIFDSEREKSLKIINNWLNENNIFSTGRYGAWEYSFIEKNIKDSKALSGRINAGNKQSIL
ncbi:MAG: NAD(P)-binding protein [Endomicrobium sp.]|jgi:protoporphyrinogen oxidase|nr:NAD(P)-binding protein [Endomicrobium sp.]